MRLLLCVIDIDKSGESNGRPHSCSSKTASALATLYECFVRCNWNDQVACCTVDRVTNLGARRVDQSPGRAVPLSLGVFLLANLLCCLPCSLTHMFFPGTAEACYLHHGKDKLIGKTVSSQSHTPDPTHR
jgi:hypothetical protein